MNPDKEVGCNHCNTIKKLDEIINFDSDNVKCKDCECEDLSIKYEKYDFFLNPVEENKTGVKDQPKKNKVLAWCLG